MLAGPLVLYKFHLAREEYNFVSSDIKSAMFGGKVCYTWPADDNRASVIFNEFKFIESSVSCGMRFFLGGRLS